MNALEDAWFLGAERDSAVSEELAAIDERPEPDFTRLKVSLGCLLAALVMLVLPVFKSSPRAAPPVAVAPVAKKAPAQIAITMHTPTKPSKPKAKPAKKAKRVPGKIIARK